MTKPKTLDQLRAEKERAETQLAQEKHKLERLENRKKYLEKGERTKRTHRLCNLGGSLDFGQGKDVFHQLCHFGACEIFDLRGKALNRAAQIAKTMGALGAFAFLQILLSVLQTLQLVLFLSEVQRAVRHMAIIHIKQANKEKELKANGTISSECHAD